MLVARDKAILIKIWITAQQNRDANRPRRVHIRQKRSMTKFLEQTWPKKCLMLPRRRRGWCNSALPP